MALDKEVFRKVRLESAAKAKKKLPTAIVITLSLFVAGIYVVVNNESGGIPAEVFGLAALTVLSLSWSISLYVSSTPNLEEGDEYIERLNRKFGNKEG
ncbi:hypothetical protein DC915_RS02225 [Vibrio parahaemolyticus]|nr:hypothetical protein [Vibrio parahaemolyticus]EJG0009792.1 hypothetical protein [Vibrio parahaemolyticus]